MAAYEGYVYMPKSTRKTVQISAVYARRWLKAAYGSQVGAELIDHIESFPLHATGRNLVERMEEQGLDTAGGKVLFMDVDDVDFRHQLPQSILV